MEKAQGTPSAASPKDEAAAASCSDHGRPSGSPRQELERAAQVKYRAKIHKMLEILQRLVRPKEEQLRVGPRLRNGQMSKTSILSQTIKIIRKVKLDDEVMAIAERVEMKLASRNNAASSMLNTSSHPHDVSQEARTEPHVPAHPIALPFVEVSIPSLNGLAQPFNDQGMSVMNLPDAAIDNSCYASSQLKSSVESAFFLKNWVATISPPHSDGGDTDWGKPVTLKSYELVPDLDSPDESISRTSTVPTAADMHGIVQPTAAGIYGFVQQ